jgi:hypothetical protein
MTQQDNGQDNGQDNDGNGLEPDREQEMAREIGSEDEADLHTDVDDAEVQQELQVEASIEEGVRPWRIAEALLALRKQVNALAPGRSKASDGAIGDPAHQSRASDHNPWVTDGAGGVVTAMDITHDPAHGCDAGRLAETLRTARDGRVKYIISNRRIAAAEPKQGQPPWAWRPYAGRNPHDHHVHISVHPEKAKYDSTAKWPIDGAFGGG